MHVWRGFHASRRAGPSAVAIGNFDGVHLGHQAMLRQLVATARARGLAPTVLTFEPHPRDFFAAQAAAAGRAAPVPPARISTLRDKLAALAGCGVERTCVLRFDARLAQLSPEAFARDVLAEGLGAAHVLVGDDFRFGARRAGDHARLAALGAGLGFDVARLGSVALDGLRVSSSAVREALAAGDLPRAAELLGRPYAIRGRVRAGRRLGRELGFRTLNVRFGHARPAAGGIFVARVAGLIDGDGPGLPAVASLGVRPTVEDAGRVLLETHVLDWPAGLGPEAGYGRCIAVELVRWLHAERRYDSLDALRAAIADDTAQARAWFAHPASARD